MTAQPTKKDFAEPKRERMELRVASSAKEMIRRAMAVSGMSAGDLAYEGARRVLEAHDRMDLAGADVDAFLNAIAEPPPPNEHLIDAFRRYRAITG